MQPQRDQGTCVGTTIRNLLAHMRRTVLASHWLPNVRVSNTVQACQLASLSAQPASGVSCIEVPRDPAARVRFVHEWMAKHQRKVVGGGMASTLVLPLLAHATEGKVALSELQAQLDAALIPIESLPEIVSVVLNDDGTAIVSDAEGTQTLLEADAFTLDQGEVMVTEAQALSLSLATPITFSTPLADISTPLADEADSLASTTDADPSPTAEPTAESSGLALSTTQIVLGALGAGAAAAAATTLGGGSSSSDSTRTTESTASTELAESGDDGAETITGFVIDGYIAGAEVELLDANGNVLGTAITDRDGSYSVELSAADVENIAIIQAVGGNDAVDISTGLAFNGTLQAPAGSTVVTPLTTLLAMKGDDGEPVITETALKRALGLDGTERSLLTDDPIANKDGALLVAGIKVALALSTAAPGGGEDYTAAAQAIATSLRGDDGKGVEPATANNFINNVLEDLDVPVLARIELGRSLRLLDELDTFKDNFVQDYQQGKDESVLRSTQLDAQGPERKRLAESEPELTLEEALIFFDTTDDLPEGYQIDPDHPFDAGAVSVAVAHSVAKILANASNPNELTLEALFNWSLEDTLANLAAADAAVIDGADALTLTETAFTAKPVNSTVAGLADAIAAAEATFFSAVEQAIIEAATNGGEVEITVPYALTGSQSDDTLIGNAGDNVLEGLGGDDTLDITAGGSNTLLFGTTRALNGEDRVLGFTTGDTAAGGDVIAFSDLNAAELRGAGTQAQAFGSAGEVDLGDDTGFVVFTTAVSLTPDPSDPDPALVNLVRGMEEGDVLYVLAAEEEMSDALMARVERTGTGFTENDLDAELLVVFEGLGVAGLRDITDDNLAQFNLL